MSDKHLPKYAVVKNHLKALALEKGEGYKIPSITELVEQYGMSTTTILRALRELMSEGYFRTVQGSGTFVAKSPEQNNGNNGSNGKNIGLIYTDQVSQSYPWFSEVTRNVTFIARNHGYNIVMLLEQNDHLFGTGSNKLANDIEDGYYAGLLLAHKATIADRNSLLEFGIPFVNIGSDYPDEDMYLVTTNQYSNYKILNYCVKKGRKNILYISGPSLYNAHHQCLNAYKACMEENNLVFDEKNFVAVEWTEKAAYDIVYDRFASDGDKPNAVVADDGILAYGAYCALKELHIEVPEEVLIVQVSEIFANPTLHGIVPYLDIAVGKQARQATNMLIKLIEGEEVPERKIYLEASIHEPKFTKARKKTLLAEQSGL